jgi:hypothetical protein
MTITVPQDSAFKRVSPLRREEDRHDRSLLHDQYREQCRQEELPHYSCKNYLAFAQNVREKTLKESSFVEPIDVHCRVRMVEWCFQVVDFAKLRRDTVSVALSLLDRYLSSQSPHAKEVILSRKLYQLASMSALFLAIKMCEKTVINASVFADLSRGSYTKEDVIEMENIILKALDWRVNGPTTHGVLRCVIDLLLEETQFVFAKKPSFRELCNFQLDLSIGDYFFCTQRPSVTAFAAIVNAIENEKSLCASECEDILTELSSLSEVDLHSTNLQNVKNRLRILLKTNGITLENPRESISEERVLSPLCVSGIPRVVSDVCMS